MSPVAGADRRPEGPLSAGKIVDSVFALLLRYGCNTSADVTDNRAFALQAMCLLFFRYPRCLNTTIAYKCLEQGTRMVRLCA